MLEDVLDDQGFRALAHGDRRTLLRLIGTDERPVALPLEAGAQLQLFDKSRR